MGKGDLRALLRALLRPLLRPLPLLLLEFDADCTSAGGGLIASIDTSTSPAGEEARSSTCGGASSRVLSDTGDGPSDDSAPTSNDSSASVPIAAYAWRAPVVPSRRSRYSWRSESVRTVCGLSSAWLQHQSRNFAPATPKVCRCTTIIALTITTTMVATNVCRASSRSEMLLV